MCDAQSLQRIAASTAYGVRVGKFSAAGVVAAGNGTTAQLYERKCFHICFFAGVVMLGPSFFLREIVADFHIFEFTKSTLSCDHCANLC